MSCLQNFWSKTGETTGEEVEKIKMEEEEGTDERTGYTPPYSNEDPKIDF